MTEAETPAAVDAPANQASAGHFFRKFSQATSAAVGSPIAFVTALLIVLAWATSGPLFGFSDTWQLVINTATTIVTFLMVFLIQNTQNRDSRAIQLKLDELIRVIAEARDELIDIEDDDDAEVKRLQHEFQAMHTHPAAK